MANDAKPARKVEEIATPMLDKIAASRDAGSQEIGSFLDWLLHERGIKLAQYHAGSWTCEDCGQVDKAEVTFTGWMSSDDAACRHTSNKCSGFKVRKAQLFANGASVSLRDCPQGGAVEHIAEGLYPAERASIQSLLAEYFEIDEAQAERERCAMLDAMRKAR